MKYLQNVVILFSKILLLPIPKLLPNLLVMLEIILIYNHNINFIQILYVFSSEKA
jgi:hypothetical protein